MLKKKNENSKEIKAFIGKDCKFEGKFVFKGSVKIDGFFEGEIYSESGTLIIGETATIKGKIKTANVINKGKVEGNIEAEKIENFVPGNIFGNIITNSFFIQAGAIFDGECRMVKDKIQSEEYVDSENKIKKLEAK